MVIAVLAVSVGVVAVNLSNVSPKHRLRSAAAELGSRIEWMWDESVTRGLTMYMNYDLSAEPQLYGVYIPAFIDEKSGARVEANELLPRPIPPEVKIKYIKLPDGRSYVSGRHSIEFNPLRTVGTHIVCLENRLGQVISMKANAYSGIVSYHTDELSFHEHQEEGY